MKQLLFLLMLVASTLSYSQPVSNPADVYTTRSWDDISDKTEQINLSGRELLYVDYNPGPIVEKNLMTKEEAVSAAVTLIKVLILGEYKDFSISPYKMNILLINDGSGIVIMYQTKRGVHEEGWYVYHINGIVNVPSRLGYRQMVLK